ncbi:MAG TPA: glycosyltransferase family 1 protein [Thermodesulfobacteriota bacterium]|nr:glycosyltransferase family 1 protein [Thermodesulfobacteriota bacterium]
MSILKTRYWDLRPRVWLKKLKDRGCAEYSVISVDPPVFYVYLGRDLAPVYKLLKDRDAYFLFAFTRSMEERSVVENLKKNTEDHEKKFPRHRFIFLCNAKREVELLGGYGLSAHLINHNCFVDERIFTVKAGVEKFCDAVYDAQLSRVKRHYLASEIESLAFITYLFYPGLKEPYVLDVMRRFDKAHWFNRPYGRDHRLLVPGEVADALNKCRVGLCLSAEEGGMYASIQYMLCGLPVVSTRSRGGRDEFFDERYVRIVDDSPGAVKSGVEEMINRNIPAGLIRGETIKKITAHRERFIELVQGIYGEQGVDRDFRLEWGQIFFNKMLKKRKIDEAVKIISKKVSPP